VTEREKEWAVKASRFIRAEVKRAGIGYRELAERLNAHGLQETEDSISAKLSRGTFAVTFFLAVLAVLEREGVRLAEL
jgi:urease accessory protein UreF